MAKYRRVRIGSRIYRIRQNISWDLKNQAEQLADFLISQYRFDGWLRREDVPRILIERGLLDPQYENQLKMLHKRLEDYKFQLYLERENPALTKKNSQNIERAKRSLLEISNKLLMLESVTLEGYAGTEAARFVLRRSVRPRLSTFGELLQVERALSGDMVSSEEIRKIARTEPWRSYWGARKQGAFRLQPLSSEQLTLSSFSKMYDGVYKHSERPPDFVIENDDMLDGWIIYVTKDDKSKEKMTSKIAGSREVFTMVDSQVDANEMYARSAPESRFIQQSRQKQMEQQGAVRYTDFSDVKRERFLNAKK